MSDNELISDLALEYQRALRWAKRRLEAAEAKPENDEEEYVIHHDRNYLER